MATTYNPYSDIKSIYDLKGQWDEANKAGDKNKTNQIAATAQAYYDKLKNNGYSGVATALSASGYKDAKKILDSYAPTTTNTTTTVNTNTTAKAPDSTTLSTPELITTNNNETRNKINSLWGTQTSDREMMTDKYNKLEETAYSNPFTTDEAKAILAKYDLAGLQGRDNAVASGSATNGGNIDSYAAANAMRQQASLVNQGQMAVLDAHNNRINNVQNTLSNLGVYLQNQDKGMQTTIGLQQNEAQRLFDNDETAKNNEVARKSEVASVTGYTPTEWTIQNDDVYSTYLNADGSFKEEMKDIDIQALINSAKASGDTETAKKLAVVRGRKILSNYGEYGQYSNQGDISYMSPQLTEAARQANLENETALKSLGIEADLSKYGIDANNKNALDQIKAQTAAEKELLEFQANLTGNGITKLSDSAIKTADTVIKNINNKLKTHTSNTDGRDLIMSNGDGTYTFNFPSNAPTADSWRWEIIPEIANCSLTDDEKIFVLRQLGYDQQDLIDVLGNDYKD